LELKGGECGNKTRFHIKSRGASAKFLRVLSERGGHKLCLRRSGNGTSEPGNSEEIGKQKLIFSHGKCGREKKILTSRVAEGINGLTCVSRGSHSKKRESNKTKGKERGADLSVTHSQYLRNPLSRDHLCLRGKIFHWGGRKKPEEGKGE